MRVKRGVLGGGGQGLLKSPRHSWHHRTEPLPAYPSKMLNAERPKCDKVSKDFRKETPKFHPEGLKPS